MGLIQGQLLDAAISDSMTKPGFNDPGVTAQVMSRLAAQGARDYALAARVGGFTARGRSAYQDAFGADHARLVALPPDQQLPRPRSATVINGLNDAHQSGFPTGSSSPGCSIRPPWRRACSGRWAACRSASASAPEGQTG